MAGIRSCGAYIPKHRLGKETAGWGFAGEKAVGNFDEDSVTLAVAAGMDCLRGIDPSEVDGILFATTTPPYLEKQGAAIIAAALDLRRDIASADVTNVLRAGTSALRMAMDSVRAGAARNVLVVAADCRMANPKGAMDRSLGDGAAAVLVSAGAGIAEIESDYHLTDNMLDVWRASGDPVVRSWEDRFVIEEGVQRVIPEAVKAFLAQANLSPADFAKAAYHSPDARRHSEIGRLLGFKPEQVQDPLYGQVGNTGTAFPLMLLVAALEEAKPGDRILVAGYGDGCDVYSVRATDAITGAGDGRLGVSGHVAAKRVLKSYEEYARWRSLMSVEGVRRPDVGGPSVSALWRDSDQVIHLHGSRCRKCGYVQFPAQRVCVECQAKDEADPVRLADRGAEIFTYSMDYLAGTTDVPMVVTVVNFNGGGRMICMMTDRDIEEIRVGLPVEMTFRNLRFAGGIHNYYWKSMPVRVQAGG